MNKYQNVKQRQHLFHTCLLLILSSHTAFQGQLAFFTPEYDFTKLRTQLQTLFLNFGIQKALLTLGLNLINFLLQ